MSTLYTKTVNRPTLQTAVIKWFLAEAMSFEQETALANSAAGQATPGLLDIGTVMGRQAGGAPAAAVAGAGNTGNGTVSAPAAAVGIQVGTYFIEFSAATKFNVFDPAGKLVGEGATGVAFANQIGFTITAGGTAFADGDSFTVAVAAGSGKVVPLNLAATDGSAVAIGIVARQVTVPSGADVPAVLLERLATVDSSNLIWPGGITTQQQATALAQLAQAFIIARPE